MLHNVIKAVLKKDSQNFVKDLLQFGEHKLEGAVERNGVLFLS